MNEIKIPIYGPGPTSSFNFSLYKVLFEFNFRPKAAATPSQQHFTNLCMPTSSEWSVSSCFLEWGKN